MRSSSGEGLELGRACVTLCEGLTFQGVCLMGTFELVAVPVNTVCVFNVPQ